MSLTCNAGDVKCGGRRPCFCVWLTCNAGGVKCGGRRPCLTRPLLELVCAWLTREPLLCLASLRHSHAAVSSQRPTLWTSPTKPNMQTAVPGLIRWCSQATLVRFVLCFISYHYACRFFINHLLCELVLVVCERGLYFFCVLFLSDINPALQMFTTGHVVLWNVIILFCQNLLTTEWLPDYRSVLHQLFCLVCAL